MAHPSSQQGQWLAGSGPAGPCGKHYLGPARAARSSPRHASCCCSRGRCCRLSSANVTHFQAIHSPGSSLPTGSSPLAAHPSPLLETTGAASPVEKAAVIYRWRCGVGQHGCLCGEKSLGNHGSNGVGGVGRGVGRQLSFGTPNMGTHLIFSESYFHVFLFKVE